MIGLTSELYREFYDQFYESQDVTHPTHMNMLLLQTVPLSFEYCVDAAQQLLPSLRQWFAEYRSSRCQSLDDQAQMILDLRIATLFIILNSYRLHEVLYLMDAEQADLDEIQSLLEPSLSFVNCVLGDTGGSASFGLERQWLSCFKVQYELAIRYIVEVLTICRRREWHMYSAKLEAVYRRIVENRSHHLRICDKGVTLLMNWHQKVFGD